MAGSEYITNAIMFHHFHEAGDQFGPGSVDIQFFHEVLKAELKTGTRFLSLEEMYSKCKAGSLSERDLLLTFDDGLGCHARTVAPVLRDLNIPAVFYVIADSIVGDYSSITEQMRFLVIQCASNGLSFPNIFFSGCEQLFGVDVAAMTAQAELKGFLTDKKYLTPRDRVVRYIRDTVLDNCELKQLFDYLGNVYFGGQTKWDFHMTASEVAELRDQGFAIGSHSASHCNLLDCPTSQVVSDYQRSLDILDPYLSSTRTLSFPFGRFGVREAREIGELGFCLGFLASPIGQTNRYGSIIVMPRTNHVAWLNDE